MLEAPIGCRSGADGMASGLMLQSASMHARDTGEKPPHMHMHLAHACGPMSGDHPVGIDQGRRTECCLTYVERIMPSYVLQVGQA